MSHATPANNESRPATTNRNGSVTDGAAAVSGAADFFAAGAGGLAMADAGKGASIRLLLGFADESALFQFGIQQGRSPACARKNRRAFRQRGDRFEDLHQRLRRLETARIQFDHLRHHDWSGLERVNSMENGCVARTACFRWAGM